MAHEEHNWIRPKKKICVVTVTRPSLFFWPKIPDPRLFFPFSKKIKLMTWDFYSSSTFLSVSFAVFPLVCLHYLPINLTSIPEHTLERRHGSVFCCKCGFDTQSWAWSIRLLNIEALGEIGQSESAKLCSRTWRHVFHSGPFVHSCRPVYQSENNLWKTFYKVVKILDAIAIDNGGRGICSTKLCWRGV